jgi:secondary thiamine-phosphate synthase enzyme
MTSIEVRTTQSEEFIDITESVRSLVRKEFQAEEEGLCLVYCPHTTAGLTVNECADPAVPLDMMDVFRHVVPEGATWRHLEGNSPAHAMATLTGSSVLLPISKGTLKLGRWQGVFLCEFDGPRTREVWVQILS